MDRVTVKIMSYACKMADITEEGVSCKRRLVSTNLITNNLLCIIVRYFCQMHACHWRYAK